jgi:hypothetical protein
MTIGSLKHHAIVTKLLHARQDVSHKLEILSAVEHPQSFKEMKIRVGVSSIAEQYSLPRAVIGKEDRPWCYDDLPITTVLNNTTDFQPPQPVLVNLINIPPAYRVR